MDELNIKIAAMIEYIEILTSIAINKNQHELANKLDIIKERVEFAKTDDELNIYKSTIKEIDDSLNQLTRELTYREKALVERGYSKKEVLELSSFTQKQFDEKKTIIIDRITKNNKRVHNPISIYIGGQPGCGKTTLSRKLRMQPNENGLVEISLDNYRSYHPNYLKMEECIKKHWKNKVETDNDSKGNDIADFTHNFVELMSDALLDEVTKPVDSKAYNIVLEWGMRNPDAPLERLRNMKQLGYTNIVDFIVVNKKLSREACKIRANVMNNYNHIIRRVPDYFHEQCITSLPKSAKKIYEIGYKKEKV